MIDLTLDSILIPYIDGYTQPFGTMIEKTHANKGGLSTREVNNNIISAFGKMRPVIISFDEETSNRVEYDARLLINAESQITLILHNASYMGCTINIINQTALTHTLSCTSVSQNTPIIPANTQIELLWNGTAWQNTLAPAVGKEIIQYPTEKSPELLYPCTSWQEVNLGGAFLRSYKENVSAEFIEEGDSLIPQSQGTAKNGLYFEPGRTSASDPKLYSDTEPQTNRPQFNGGKPSHYHTISAPVSDTTVVARNDDVLDASNNWYDRSSVVEVTGMPTSSSAQISFSGKTTGTHYHSYTPAGTISSTDPETRPINYTVKVWKRIA